MNNSLFDVDFRNDPHALAKAFFNSIADMRFSERFEKLVSLQHCADEFHGCSFPHDVDYNEETFEGVKFRFHDEEIIVSMETYKNLIRAAGLKYLERHPEKKSEIQPLLERIAKL